MLEPGLLPGEGGGHSPHDQVDGDGGQGEAGSHQQRAQGGAVIYIQMKKVSI